MNEIRIWSIGEMIMRGSHRSTRRKTYPCVTLYTQIHIEWSGADRGW